MRASPAWLALSERQVFGSQSGSQSAVFALVRDFKADLGLEWIISFIFYS